jgi:MFS family permease
LLFDDIHRTRALSAYASLSAVASIVAPVAGGISIAILGWAGVFWFRVPIAILALALLPFVPSLRAAPEDGLEVRGQALIGSTLLAGGLAAALLAFPLATSAQTRMLALPAGLLGACGLAVFALHQRRARTALLPRPLLYDIDLVLANGASVIVSFAAFAVPLLVPYYLERIAGLSPLAAGIALACSPVGILAGSMAAAGVVRKIGAARALLAGALAVAIGQLAIAVWGLAPPFALMVFSLAGQGAGWGLFQVAYTDVAVAALSRRDRGVAGSIAMLTRTIGVITAAALLTALLASTEARHLVAGEAADAAFVQAFATVFVTTSVLVATFLGVQLLRRRRAR